MYSLSKAADLVSRWPVSMQAQRAAMVARLDALVACCQEATRIWQSYASSPGAPGDRHSLVVWVGPERARQLFDIQLAARREAQALCDLAGPAAGRLVGLDEQVIETAYRQLGEGETGSQAAATALARLDQRIQYLNGLKQRLRAAPMVKAGASAGKKPTAKKPVFAKKTATGKKSAAKKAAPKKK